MRRKKALSSSRSSYLISTGIVLTVSIVLALLLQIYPFGGKGLMFIDGSQYFSVMGFLQRSLLTGDSILYNWGNVLGGSAIPILAYYASSPFNLLLLLFPHNLLLGAHVVILIKLLCAALAFCLLLDHWTEGHFWEKGVAAGCYPFMAYAVTYIWNISWLDGIVVVPLVYLGIRQLVREKKVLLYVLSLGFIIFSNYYIGFMLCIGSVLFYLTELAVSPQGFRSALKHSFWLFALCSLLAGGLSMVLCLPAVMALPSDRTQTLLDMLRTNKQLASFTHMAQMPFAGNWALLTDLPILFIGIPQLVLAISFFLNSRIPGKQKLASAALILVFLLSFHQSFPNEIWHGSSAPNSFDYRYSFLLGFFLQLLAFDSLVHLRGSRKLCLLSGLLAGLFWLLGLNLNICACAPIIRILDFVMIGISVLCIWALLSREQLKSLSLGILSLIMVFSMAENAVLMLLPRGNPEILGSDYADMCEKIDRSPSLHCGAGYLQAKEQMDPILNSLPGDSFYRIETLENWYLCDASLFGYAGVTNFASSENPELTALCASLGIPRYHKSYTDYDRYIPCSADSLLGIRYLLSATPLSLKEHYPANRLPTGQLLYENPYALPLIFPADSLDNDMPTGELPFKRINRYFASLTSEDIPVFTPVADGPAAIENDTDLHYRFTVPDDRPVFFSNPLDQQPRILLTVNGQQYRSDLDNAHRIFYLGSWEEGTQVQLDIHYDTPIYTKLSAVYQEDLSAIARITAEIPPVNIQKISNRELTLTVNTVKAGQPIATTIPYDEGWQIWDNGRPLPIQPNWNNSFLAFTLEEAGTHELRLLYTPKGLYAGLGLSLVSLAGLAILVFALKKKQNHK